MLFESRKKGRKLSEKNINECTPAIERSNLMAFLESTYYLFQTLAMLSFSVIV